MQHNTLGIVRDFLSRTVKEGDFCIDATAGKGRDTALLCSLAGKSGRVLAFDIQKEAVEATKKLLAESGLTAEVFLDSHENILRYADKNSVDAVVFNLGRLPGGNTHIFTKAETTLRAIDAALEALKPGGAAVISLYYGGDNGFEERDAVLKYVEKLDQARFSVLACSWPNRKNDPPLPIFIWKELPSL